MKLFKQFYFILYIHFYNKAQYNRKIAVSPSGYASTFFSISSCGWLVLLYDLIIGIFNLQVFNEKYGSIIFIVLAIIFYGMINNFFDVRYISIYNEYANSKINKNRIFVFLILFFIIPFLIILLLSLTNTLHLFPSHSS